MPEILRALAQPLISGKDGMQASSHPRLLANSPASLTSRDRHRHAGLGSRVFLTTKSSAVLRPGQICSQQLPLHCGSLCVGSPKTHARIPAQGTGGAQFVSLLMPTDPDMDIRLVPTRTGTHAARYPHAQPAMLLLLPCTHTHTHAPQPPSMPSCAPRLLLCKPDSHRLTPCRPPGGHKQEEVPTQPQGDTGNSCSTKGWQAPAGLCGCC